MDCIYEGERMLYIHPDECVTVARANRCARWKRSSTRRRARPVEGLYKANVEFFEDLGPRRRRKVGKINKDHPVVAALPPQEQES